MGYDILLPNEPQVPPTALGSAGEGSSVPSLFALQMASENFASYRNNKTQQMSVSSGGKRSLLVLSVPVKRSIFRFSCCSIWSGGAGNGAVSCASLPSSWGRANLRCSLRGSRTGAQPRFSQVEVKLPWDLPVPHPCGLGALHISGTWRSSHPLRLSAARETKNLQPARLFKGSCNMLLLWVIAGFF